MPSPFKILTHMQTLAGATEALQNSVKNQALLKDEFAQLRTLRAVITEHGLNRSLIAYANHDQQLVKLVPSIPAVESLNAVPMHKNDRRLLVALEEIDATLDSQTTTFVEWLRKLATDLAAYLTSANDVSTDMSESVDDMTEAMQDKIVTDVLRDTTLRMTRPADGFVTILSVVEERLKQIGAIDVDAFFSSPEYRETCASVIRTMVEEFKPLIGIAMAEDGSITRQEDAVDDAYLPREATLTDLGFTDECTQTILDKSRAVLDAINSLALRQDDITSALTNLADHMNAPDTTNDLDMTQAQSLIANYTDVIALLVSDGIRHINEALDVISDIVDAADTRSDDGRSD